MIPGVYENPLKIKQGDTFISDTFTLASLASYDGPSVITEEMITAQLRTGPSASEYLSFEVETVDAEEMKFRFRLTPAQTLTLAREEYVWDMQITDEGQDPAWVGTPIEGTAIRLRQVTQ